jgi:hypothetical protein
LWGTYECVTNNKLADARSYFQLAVRYSSNQELISNAEEFLYEIRSRENAVTATNHQLKSQKKASDRGSDLSDWGAEFGHRVIRFAIISVGLVTIFKIIGNDDASKIKPYEKTRISTYDNLTSSPKPARASKPQSSSPESSSNPIETGKPIEKKSVSLESEKSQRPAKKTQNKAEIDRWIRRIETIAMGRWIRPKGLKVKNSAILTVELDDGGSLIRVRTQKTSGDAMLDKSFETAVREAAPFIIPDDPDVAPYLRSFSITLTPPW